MAQQVQVDFMLYVDGSPSSGHDSLEEAQASASAHMARKAQLRIVTFSAPAPSQAWYYDYAVQGWVHQPNAAVGA
jgi:hypothetical protein